MAESILSTNEHNIPLQSQESVYPYNQVQRSASGHIIEIDDTLGAERLHRQHKSGSYETFDARGGHTLHVIGDRYQVTIQDNHIDIGGTCAVTILGDCQTYVRGDYNLRVGGDYNLVVDGKIRNQCGGGVINEITGDYASNISGNSVTTVHESLISKINGSETITVGEKSTRSVVGDSHTIVNGNSVCFTSGSSFCLASGALSLGGNKLDFGSATTLNVSIPGGGNFTGGVITSDTDFVASSVSLIDHIHKDGENMDTSAPVVS